MTIIIISSAQYTQDREKKTISIYFISLLVFRFEFLQKYNNNIGNTTPSTQHQTKPMITLVEFYFFKSSRWYRQF